MTSLAHARHRAPKRDNVETTVDPGVQAADGWSGEFSLTTGILTFSGAIGTAPAHAHAAVQVIDLHRGQMVLRDASGTTRTATRAVIPAGVRHEITATTDAVGVMRLLDPATAAARAATADLRRIGGNPTTVDTWLAGHHPGHSPDSAEHRRPEHDIHPALATVLAAAPQLVTGPMTLAELADQAGISASRLGHLFVEQLGLTFPAWRRWTRLQHAIHQATAGASLTDAAHAAGFADSAHLTRTCRAMLGMSPTDALRASGGSRRNRAH